MPNPLVEHARHSIHAVHALIHTVFTDRGGDGAAAIERLLPAFAEHFSMVTTAGAVVGREQVEQLFRGAVGARPGLEILVSDLHMLWHEGQSVAIRYKETHRLGQQESSRLSVAIIQVREGSAQWLYLHETATG
ncbi:hypothetical protein [Pseudomonas chlororaphis]|uniref:DUF4440 domain-containing protein n=1 Tax=Pseudomonas chlororaphis TaxID=587753 RepID=A0A0D5Y3T7_9PSED|nr:hypothetical protein [Pseudomonas chlororaphis]AKA26028.1 hypothetical protein PCL1606_45810 [Pseudomonas chlororaphis]